MRRADRDFLRYRESGDPRALGRVFDRCAPILWRVAAQLVGTRDEAEDLVQGSFLIAMQRARSWDPTRPLLPWLLGILSKRALQARARRERSVDTEAEPVDRAPGPYEWAAARELQRSIRSSIAELPAKYRAVLEAHLVEGRTPTEIAESTRQRAGTVRMRVHRGLRLLRGRLPKGLAPSGLPLVMPVAFRQQLGARLLAPGTEAVAVGGASPFPFVVGGFVMPKWTWVSTLLLLGLGAGVWWVGSERDPEHEGESEIVAVHSEMAEQPDPEPVPVSTARRRDHGGDGPDAALATGFGALPNLGYEWRTDCPRSHQLRCRIRGSLSTGRARRDRAGPRPRAPPRWPLPRLGLCSQSLPGLSLWSSRSLAGGTDDRRIGEPAGRGPSRPWGVARTRSECAR